MQRLHRVSTKDGFTFIEVVVTMFIVAIAAIAMLQGVVYAKSMIRSVHLENRALEELQNYIEEYRAVISGIGESNRHYIVAPNTPKRVVLSDDADGGQVVYGYIDRESLQRRIISHTYRNAPYYHMKAWIEWDENPNDGKDIERRLELQVSLFEFP